VLGGLLAGTAGAYLSLSYTQLWSERMTAGQGWIAVGLVIVARWHPVGAALAAYGFGALTVLHPQLQAAGVAAPSYLIAMLPYVAAVVALTVTTSWLSGRGDVLPGALGRAFRPSDK
jgi:simple sugar transport system permease protein